MARAACAFVDVVATVCAVVSRNARARVGGNLVVARCAVQASHGHALVDVGFAMRALVALGAVTRVAVDLVVARTAVLAFDANAFVDVVLA